ncbi:lasso peptide biosynthesis B2 protein [Rubrivirga sp.]|uniref:lasso peptide biosynthesis B2 protein n=1 Tax=Rubrivirga sp. TaxID=1885344 RepID=UPI003B527AB9
MLVDLAYGTVAFELLKRFVSLPTLVRHIASPRTRREAVDVDGAIRVVKGVLRRVYRRDYCLPQSLVLYRILARAGRQPRLQIGVRHDGPGLDGHAWVTLDGRPLGERADPARTFATTFHFPLTSPAL